MATTGTGNGQITLMLIHGAWLSAPSCENDVDYFGKRGFAVSAPEWPSKQGDVDMAAPDWQEVVEAIDSRLDGVLHAPIADAQTTA